MHPRPTNGLTPPDYPTAVGHLIDAMDRRLKGNLLDNGAFQVWQRGTTIAAGASPVITADRWAFWRTGGVTGATVSRQTGGNAQYCARVQRDNTNASTAVINFAQALESQASIPYRSRNLALAFRARMGANYSAASAALAVSLVSGTGTDQSISSGFTGQATVASSSVTLTSSFQDFLVTVAAPGSSITQLAAQFAFTPVGTAGAADYFEVEQVQLVYGDYVGYFPYRAPSEELAICLRQLWIPDTVSSASGWPAFLVSTSLARTSIKTPVTMRATPATTGSTASSLNVNHAGGNAAGSSISYGGGADGGSLDVTVAGTPFTAGQAASVATVSRGLILTAELL